MYLRKLRVINGESMSVFNAGLPQKIAQAKQLGDIDFRPDCGTFINEPDKSILMRSGVVAPASQFPRAAKHNHLKVIGSLSSGTIPTFVNVTQWATNGAGTYVVCHGSGTSLLVTTDWGKNWVVVNLSSQLNGVMPVAVVYTGARFVVAGNSAATCYVAYSADAATWSAGGTLSANISGATANSIRGAWNGSVALFIAGGDVDAAFTTANGTALTQVAAPAVIGNPGLVVGDGKFLLYSASGSGTVYHSASGAGSWTTVALPLPIGQVHFTNGVWVFWQASPYVAYVTSSDLTLFTIRNFPFNQTAHAPQRLTGDASRFYVSIKINIGSYGFPGVAYSIDGINWVMRYLIQGINDLSASWGCIDGRIFVPFCNPGATSISVASALYAADFNVASYVGIPYAYYADGAGTTASPVAYVRVKV